MEISTNYLLVFDACSFINLINIDYEHQEIIEYLSEYFDFRFPEKVEAEIEDNAKNKLDSIEVRTKKDKEYKEDLENYIDILIGNLWENVVQDTQIKKDLGENIYAKLAEVIGHKSKDGEWYCVAHSLYLSRIHETRLSFITDDYPAIDRYQDFFNYQKIGLVEDTSDFLVLLFWTCPEIDQEKLQRYLRDLYSEYRSEVNELLKNIRNFRDEKLGARDTQLRIKISEFEELLSKLDLTNLKTKKNEILDISNKFERPLRTIFSKHENLFDLSSDYNLISKIEILLSKLEKDKIFKLYGKNSST